MIAKLLGYMSTIEEIAAYGLSTNRSNFMETIGHYWENTSKAGSEHLHIECFEDCPDNIDTAFDITKKSGREETVITLKYPTHIDFDWRAYKSFIGNSGKYIGSISFDILMEGHIGRSALPENFFPQTLAHCPHLKKLQISGCLIKHFICPEVDNKFTIEELSFQFCKIQHGMFDQLSSLFGEIKQLHLCNNTTYFPDDEPVNINNYLDIQITMPHTAINRIIFLVIGPRDVVFVKVVVSTDEN